MLKVTEKAMRPALPDRQCFYCQQPIGSNHKDDCVLVQKRVKVRLTIEYDRVVPAFWDKDMIEFQMNESSWCLDNCLHEIDKMLKAEQSCLCCYAEGKVLEMSEDKFLDEIGE